MNDKEPKVMRFWVKIGRFASKVGLVIKILIFYTRMWISNVLKGEEEKR